MSQHVSDPPAEKTLPVSEPVPAPVYKSRARLSSMGIISLFALIGLSLLLFSGQIILSLAQVNSARTAQQALARPTPSSQPKQRLSGPTPTPMTAPTPTPDVNSPFFTPENMAAPALQLPAGHYVVYQSTTHIYLVSTTDNTVQPIYTPGYTYSQAVRPVLTPSGQLLYSGNQGIWLTDVFDQQPVQLVQLAPNMVLSSLVLSQDGKMIAWSADPTDGNGQISIYAGSLTSPQLVRQQSTLDCPCFRIFSFLNGNTAAADNTLLLTDDRGSNEAVQYGLWSLDLTNPSIDPQLILGEDHQQGPLTFAPYSNTLLYSTYEGAVPVPTDNSIPSDVAALSYANSLNITALGGSPLALGNSQIVLAEQHNLSNTAQYHWVTTPTFSPDGGTLAYVEFSSDNVDPYDRHSALYTFQVGGSGAQLKPMLVATSTVGLLELGPWLNSHVVTMYGDGSIYALDVQSGSQTSLAQPGGYLRILATIGTGQT